ncbi:transporter substrate-binding domain-containing protein [Verticiella sediminum]|uniref:Transporter substrate-binding domain-containing protein n=1 Tax=Verticiella sediminum TaxID=1247510 RepID=A0A556B1Y1_9BURK|nr:ABC transporter substrate-binding protein [Verticiella sediminum]TSH99163.1 transporter substrate-binding domain-containing protein [Verticiella sediminum]
MRRLLVLMQVFVACLVLPLPASAQAPKPITLAVQLNSDIPQILIAAERKLWEEQGLDVQLIPTATGRETLEALAGGQADFAVFADLPATIAALRRQPFMIIADVARYNGQRAIASKKRMKKFDSPADLDGVRLGTTLGTSVEYLTAVLLQRGNATATIVNATPADLIPALVRGDIDASVPFPSVYAQAKKLLGDDYMELKATGYAAHILLATSPAMIKDRPDDVEKFLRAVLQGEEVVVNDPTAAKEAVIRASKGVMTLDVLDSMWPDYDHRLILTNDLATYMSEQAAWVADKGMIKVEKDQGSPQALRGYIHDKPLATLAPERVRLD